MLRLGQSEAFEERSDQISNFRACCPAMQVQLVEYKKEVGIVVLFDPSPCILEDGRVDLAIEHRPEHADVRNENVWRGLLHVPTGNQLGAVDRREQEAVTRVELLGVDHP